MKQLAKLTATAVVTLLLLALLWHLRGAVLVFLLGLALAAALRPFAQRLIESGWKLGAALAATYLGAVGLFVLLVISIAGPLADDVERFGGHLHEAYDVATSPTVEKSKFLRAVAQMLPPRSTLDSFGRNPDAQTIRTALGFSAGLIGFVINAAIALVLSIYWNYDRVYFERLWLSLLSVERRTAARDLWRQIETEIGSYLRSEFVQAILAGILLYASAMLFSQPYPMFLAFMAAVAWLVPWLGGLFTLLWVVALWIPSAILGSAPNLWMTVAPMALSTIAVLSVLEFVIEPRLFDRRRYNPLLIVLISIGLADVIGLGGFLIGPPVASVIQIVASHLFLTSAVNERKQELEQPAPLGLRLSQLQAAIGEMPETPPNVVSLVDRLAVLLNEAKNLSPQSVTEMPAPRG